MRLDSRTLSPQLQVWSNRSPRSPDGFAGDEFGYSIELGLPPQTRESRSAFLHDPEIKRECLWSGEVLRPSSLLVDRQDSLVEVRNDDGGWTIVSNGLVAEIRPTHLQRVTLTAEFHCEIPGKVPLELAVHDVSGLLHPVLDTVAEEAANKTIDIEYVEPDPMNVNADAGRLQQVFANVLSNAVKFTPPHGRIRLRIDREGESAVVRITDSGEGIPRLLREKR